jgi:hypothetical protein
MSTTLGGPGRDTGGGGGGGGGGPPARSVDAENGACHGRGLEARGCLTGTVAVRG